MPRVSLEPQMGADKPRRRGRKPVAQKRSPMQEPVDDCARRDEDEREPQYGELSPEEQEAPQQAAGELGIDLERLDALGQALAKKRQAAIDARANSGIEEVWAEDEEAYIGIDDANRAEEHVNAIYGRTTKPAAGSTQAIGADDDTKKTSSRSNAYLGITASYVDGAAARVSDMLLPSDDRPWGITPTPVPELSKIAKSEVPVPRDLDGQQVDMREIAKEVQRIGKEKADAAQTRIEDWLTESQWHREVREVINDCARLGTGILKGPVPVMRKQTSWARDPQTGAVTLEVNEEVKPASYRVSPWNMFPDPLCGEDPHKGSEIWERDDITTKALLDLRGQPGYIKEQIEACIDEGPALAQVGTPIKPEDFGDDTSYEIWYRTGFLTYEDMLAAGCDCSAFKGDKYRTIPAIITMVNDRVIKASLNPLDSGEFPYDFMVWKRRRGMPWGLGVARQVRTPQRIINAGTRNMLDNAGLTAGPQIVMLRGVVHPADGVEELAPLKLWYADPDADIREVQHAFMAVQIECNQADLMAIVQFALKMAEDVTGMPQLMQGQQGDAPELVGVVQILNNNANSVLRRIARHFDDLIIEPHIGRYYTYLMQNGPDDNEKGFFVVDARGSSVLVERDIQNQAILSMAQMALNPVFRIDPFKYATESLKAQRLDPDRFMYTDEEWQEIQDAQANQPSDPRIVAAQMRAEIDSARIALEEKLAQFKAQHESQENAAQRKHEILIEGMQHELEAADLEGRNTIDAAKLKTMLATAVIAERSKALLQGREMKHARGAGKGRGI